MYPLRIVHDLRPVLPWTIYALPIDIPGGTGPQIHERRIAVRWDEDNDERVLGALLDAYYRRPESIWNVYAVAETKATLYVWTLIASSEDRAAWREAATCSAIMDAWDTEIVDGMDEVLRIGGSESIRRDKDGRRTLRFPAAHSDVNALIDLFGLGPSAPRREWKW
jgi:hypothetical protein